MPGVDPVIGEVLQTRMPVGAGDPPRPAPVLGQHSREVLLEAGYCEAEIDDMAMMRLMAREDIGLALVAPIVVTDELASGRLVEAKEHPRIRENFYAVTLRRRFPNVVVQDLLEAHAQKNILT